MNIPLILLTLATTAIAKKISCDACLNNICHKKGKIFEAHQFSGQLAIDKTKNTLYFHYEDSRRKDFTGEFELDDLIFRLLPNVNFTFGRAVNQITRELYMSADRGIYKYNPTNNRTELFGLSDKTVWHLQYHKILYYSQFQKKGLNTYSNKKKSEPIAALSNFVIDDFIVDKEGDIYFLSNFTTYVLKNGAKTAAMFEDEIYFLSTDCNSEAYFIQPYTRAIYKKDYSNRNLEEVGALKRGWIVKTVFDATNNMIYLDGTDQKLYYLVPNYHKCTVKYATRTGKSTRKSTPSIITES